MEHKKEQEQHATECFICYDSFLDENPKATPNPCKCKGSIAIHLSCLKDLMKYQSKCKACNTIYDVSLYVNIYEMINIQFAKYNFYYLQTINQTQEICDYAFTLNHECFRRINDTYKTLEQCYTVLAENKDNIEYIPKSMQTYEMIEPIIKTSIRNIPYIKKEFIDSSLMSYYISNKEKNILQYFPKDFQTPEICKQIIAYDGSQINYVRADIKTQELELLSLNTHTPSEYNFNKYSREIQQKIVKRNWHMLRYMKNPSNALCVHIIKKHPRAIELLEKPSEELIALAIRLDKNMTGAFIWSSNEYFRTKRDFIAKKVIRMEGEKGIYEMAEWIGNDINVILHEMNINKKCIINNDNYRDIKLVSI